MLCLLSKRSLLERRATFFKSVRIHIGDVVGRWVWRWRQGKARAAIRWQKLPMRELLLAGQGPEVACVVD